MEIAFTKDGSVLLVKPQEKSIEAGNSRIFKSKITEQINKGNKNILVNLSKVEFMDSSGIGGLISILKALPSVQGKLAICHANDQIMKIFILTGLDRAFEIFSNEVEALNSLKTTTKP